MRFAARLKVLSYRRLVPACIRFAVAAVIKALLLVHLSGGGGTLEFWLRDATDVELTNAYCSWISGLAN
jgi:hypothetical protein